LNLVYIQDLSDIPSRAILREKKRLKKKIKKKIRMLYPRNLVRLREEYFKV